MSCYCNVFYCVMFYCCIDSCCALPITCYIFDHIKVLIILPMIPIIESNKKKKTKLTTTTEDPITTMRKHAFEDVDWVIHPWAYNERQDCIGHYIRCIRRTTPLIPVCGFSTHTHYYEDYYSNCEIEIENCFWRLKRLPAVGMYGGVWYNNKVYHNGEMYDCKYYYRRANSPEDLDLLYFGGDKMQKLAEWNKTSERYYNSNDQLEGHYDDYTDF